MLYNILYWKSRKKLRKRELKVKALSKKCAYMSEEIRRLRQRVSVLEDGYVVEWCDNCNTQVTMLWNPAADGLAAYCPFCGRELLLCDSCHFSCDMEYGTGVCIGRKMSGR